MRIPGLCLSSRTGPVAMRIVVDDYARVEALRTGVMAQQVHARNAVCVAIAGGVFALISPRAATFAGRDLSVLSSPAAVLSSRCRPEPAQLAAVPA